MKSKSFDGLMSMAADHLMENPDYVCSPRGSEVREMIAPTLILTDPRNRVITLKSRKANYGFTVGEFLWYWRGANDLATMEYYNKRMSAFSDDGKTLNSAYGYIVKGMSEHLQPFPFETWIDQWSNCAETLIGDNDSRRAVMFICQPGHVNSAVNEGGSKDVPCTLSLQFFIREEKLHLHVHMRSNDIIWGLTADLFSFTMFQEMMLLGLKEKGLDIEMGTYYHTAGSLHVYERYYDMAKEMVSEHFKGEPHSDGLMAPFASVGEVNALARLEVLLRNGTIPEIHAENFSPSLCWMAEQLNAHRRKRDEEKR